MRKGEVTRQRILELAAPVLNQRGFAGCSMQDLMEATGLEKGGLYRHFASKQELAAAVFAYSMEQATRARMDDLPPGTDAVETLRSMVARFIEGPSPIAGGCPLLNTAVEADDTNPELRSLASDALASWKLRICKVVKEGIGREEVRRDAVPDAIANSVVGSLEGALMISRLEGSRRALKDAQATLDLLLDSIRGAKFRTFGQDRTSKSKRS